MIDATQEHEVRPSVTFKDALLQTTFAPGRALKNGVEEIELGIFGDEARNLMQTTSEDPQKREFGKTIFVTNDGRVLLQNKAIVGDEEGVTHTVKIEHIKNPYLPRYLRQEKFIGALLHSHPVDSLPSVPDLSSVLLGDDELAASTAVFVVTPVKQIVVFRGESTPHWTSDKVNKFLEELGAFATTSIANYAELSPSAEDIVKFHSLAETQMSKKLIEEYGLKVFIGGLADSKVVLQSS